MLSRRQIVLGPQIRRMSRIHSARLSEQRISTRNHCRRNRSDRNNNRPTKVIDRPSKQGITTRHVHRRNQLERKSDLPTNASDRAKDRDEAHSQTRSITSKERSSNRCHRPSKVRQGQTPRATNARGNGGRGEEPDFRTDCAEPSRSPMFCIVSCCELK
jgi:hypothetical protein